MIWSNPIFLRYCRSRLRPATLAVFLLIVLIITGFVYAAFSSFGESRANLSPEDAARVPIIALLVVQGLILFLVGTAQVAGGMTAERDEGVVDYQKLAPMTPLSKVIGYLFGLPIREYVMFVSTLPFSIYCFWKSQVPLTVVLQLYGVFLTSAILYHITGLVAGTVIKNRRWAFLVSMGVIFMLYTVVPQVAKFGLVYFKYITMYPTVEELAAYLIPPDYGAVVETAQRLAPPARFFNLNFPQSVFTVLSQGAFILTGIVMLWRRWNKNESHLLGKLGALGAFVWIQSVFLGNALPLIEPGHIFPSREFNRRFGMSFEDRFRWEPDSDEATIMVSVYGFVTLVLIWLLTLMITPGKETQIRGWRRRLKLGKTNLNPLSDPATAFPWTFLMVVVGTGCWFVFTEAIMNSHWFNEEVTPWLVILSFGLVLFNGAFLFQALCEGWGRKVLGLAVIIVGVVPFMVGAVLAITDNSFITLASWIAGSSPLSGALYAPQVALPLADLPLSLVRALPRAFWFWQGVMLLASIYFLIKLWAARRAVANNCR